MQRDIATELAFMHPTNHPQPHLAAHAPDRPQHRRTVVGIGATATALIRPAAWRISRIEMLHTFFSRVLEHFIAFRRWVGQSGFRSYPFCLRKQTMAPLQA